MADQAEENALDYAGLKERVAKWAEGAKPAGVIGGASMPSTKTIGRMMLGAIAKIDELERRIAELERRRGS